MNLDEYFANLDRKLAELQKLDWMREAVQDTHAEHMKQIFVEGEDSKGKQEKYKDGSYKKYREKRGRQTAFVDLRLEGELERDLSTSLQKFTGAWITGTKRSINSDKVNGMIKLYGEDKFRLKEETKKEFVERLKKKILEILA